MTGTMAVAEKWETFSEEQVTYMLELIYLVETRYNIECDFLDVDLRFKITKEMFQRAELLFNQEDSEFHYRGELYESEEMIPITEDVLTNNGISFSKNNCVAVSREIRSISNQLELNAILRSAYLYIKHYGELSYEDKELRDFPSRSHREIVAIFSDNEWFNDLFDVLYDEIQGYDTLTERDVFYYLPHFVKDEINKMNVDYAELEEKIRKNAKMLMQHYNVWNMTVDEKIPLYYQDTAKDFLSKNQYNFIDNLIELDFLRYEDNDKDTFCIGDNKSSKFLVEIADIFTSKRGYITKGENDFYETAKQQGLLVNN